VASQAGVIAPGMELVVLNETTEESIIERLGQLTTQLDLTPPLPPLVSGIVGFFGLDAFSLPSILRPTPAVDTAVALVLTDVSLALCLSPNVRFHFLCLAKSAAAVVCSRCSPIHKAKVVKLVAERSFLFGDATVTLAIGDGANDVPMIRFAHIGVGISGREGMQAVLSSDFAITHFAHLKQLLLIHGARAHKRIAKLVFYSFCKNLTLCLSQLWFGFFSAFSGQMMYYDFLFTLYNALFTSFPILVLASVDRDHEDSVLESSPSLYQKTSSNSNFSMSKFIGWVALGIWESLVIFFFVFFTLNETASGSLWVLGTASYTILVFAMNIQVSIITNYWTLRNIAAVASSIILYFAFIAFYCQVYNPEGYGILGEMFGTPLFWFSLVLVPLISVLPPVFKKTTRILRKKDFMYSSDIEMEADNEL
jgi:phospholipid-transporting ATPase